MPFACAQSERPSAASRRRLLALLALWGVLLGSGAFAMAAYASQPGASALAPARWPTALAAIARPDDDAVFVMSVHPHCPCTAASARELSRLSASAGDRMAVAVLFYRPAVETDEWVQGSIWNLVASIPNARRVVDADGALARELGALTSGHAVLYDRAGRLRFQGGITPGRGHEGISPGHTLVLDALDDIDHGDAVSQTFGCPIQGPPTP